MENNINPPVQTDILAEEINVFQYQFASTGQRFINYIIDNLLMNYGLSYLTGSLVGILLVAISPEFASDLFSNQNSWNILLLGYIIAIFNYIFYYTLCEKLFKGYTLGKLITGTRAVKDDGSELSFKDAILRSLSRLVPFEAFSGFGGHPWHDQWTNTMVIKTR
jgi:uncharacterized RDD family membrane protein YckC